GDILKSVIKLQNLTGQEKLECLKLRQTRRQTRRQERTAKLIQMSEEDEIQMRQTAIERSNNFNNTVWMMRHPSSKNDTLLKIMNNQIVMAKVYASIARSRDMTALHDSLTKCIKESQHVMLGARSDAELQAGAREYAKAMGKALSVAKYHLYDCAVVTRKLKAVVQSAEETLTAQMKKNFFLMQYGVQATPNPLHCLALQLTNDYFLLNDSSKTLRNKEKLEDPSLYHYAIFSDNVVATSVAVNSTVTNAKNPEKHVFHIVTDMLNFAAMKMWFISHPPLPATVHVENYDDLKWLNSSYCPVLRQLESANLREYYFAANRPSTISMGNDNLNYKNPKYLSMLNHLRFYMPELYPKLDKILFLDDDVVVQQDLSPLWSIKMFGMVNGAVETCTLKSKRLSSYLNFTHPLISKNFSPRSCAWAFGMNLFDLKEWKQKNITAIYHYWQEQNKDRKLWQLGTMPAGLTAFYNQTYLLHRSWQLLALGYNPVVKHSEINKAAVLHYNGNYKPWLDLAITQFKPYWS
ncbi:putative galacturonosyltransferase 3, partial [Ananas comosus]